MAETLRGDQFDKEPHVHRISTYPDAGRFDRRAGSVRDTYSAADAHRSSDWATDLNTGSTHRNACSDEYACAADEHAAAHGHTAPDGNPCTDRDICADEHTQACTHKGRDT